jgi:small-conductance mechanosensitive channel
MNGPEIDQIGQIWTQIIEVVVQALPGIAAGLAVICAFLLLTRITRRIFRHMAERVETDRRPLVELANETVRYALIVVGLITGLGTMGIDISALIAGLGLTGFALGFALRDALSNLLAGTLIILYRPFKPGDLITVAGNTGTVSSINFRYSILEADGKTILVPNSTMFNNTVTVQ